MTEVSTQKRRTRMKGLSIGLVGVAVVVLIPLVSACANLDESAERSVSVPVNGATSVRIDVEAGYLEVAGRPGITDVTASGTAYATNTDNLDDVQIVTRSTDTEIVIEVETSWNTKLDLVVEVPDSFQVIIDDASGSIMVTDVAGVQLSDGSGRVEINGVSGDVVVDDDGSGDIDIRNVGRNVQIVDDGSGSITVVDVAGNFHVRDDGSGDITARDIDGDFVVEDDGSGDISYSNVGGRVDIPED